MSLGFPLKAYAVICMHSSRNNNAREHYCVLGHFQESRQWGLSSFLPSACCGEINCLHVLLLYVPPKSHCLWWLLIAHHPIDRSGVLPVQLHPLFLYFSHSHTVLLLLLQYLGHFPAPTSPPPLFSYFPHPIHLWKVHLPALWYFSSFSFMFL